MQNDMRDKLVELLKNAKLCSYPFGDQYSDGTISNIADHLIENGVVCSPCKVGDVVYLIKDGFIEPCEVEGIHYTRRKNYVRIRPLFQEYIGNWSIYYTPSIRSFGKTVFPTREEAEQKLKGGVE